MFKLIFFGSAYFESDDSDLISCESFPFCGRDLGIVGIPFPVSYTCFPSVRKIDFRYGV